jgi:Pvc16 N-terminal domain
MSTDSIRDVTRALRSLLLSQMANTRSVTLMPPGDDPPGGGSGVNLYMYRLNECPQLRNQPYVGDRAGAPARPWPALSLELFYLLTPFGPIPQSDGNDEAQRALGEAMLALHENPVLNRVHLPGFDADTLPAYLLTSFEDVKIRLHPVSIDELSKIWSTIGKPYRLSVAYEVTLVQITPTRAPSVTAGVVHSTGVTVVTLDPPRLQSITPSSGPLATLAAGNVIQPNQVAVSGFHLLADGEAATIAIGDTTATPTGTPTARLATVLLPTSLLAGPDADLRAVLHGRASQPLTFHVSPWLSLVTPIRTALDPNLPTDRSLVLKGNGLTSVAEARFDAPGISRTSTTFSGASPTGITVTMPTGATSNLAPGTGIPIGIYDLRLRLADHSLTNQRQVEVLPQVNATSGYGAAGSSYVAATGVLTLNGARLDGNNVVLMVDGNPRVLGKVTTAGQIKYTFKVPLSPGRHDISLNVDGHLARSIALAV